MLLSDWFSLDCVLRKFRITFSFAIWPFLFFCAFPPFYVQVVFFYVIIYLFVIHLFKVQIFMCYSNFVLWCFQIAKFIFVQWFMFRVVNVEIFCCLWFFFSNPLLLPHPHPHTPHSLSCYMSDLCCIRESKKNWKMSRKALAKWYTNDE